MRFVLIALTYPLNSNRTERVLKELYSTGAEVVDGIDLEILLSCKLSSKASS